MLVQSSLVMSEDTMSVFCVCSCESLVTSMEKSFGGQAVCVLSWMYTVAYGVVIIDSLGTHARTHAHTNQYDSILSLPRLPSCTSHSLILHPIRSHSMQRPINTHSRVHTQFDTNCILIQSLTYSGADEDNNIGRFY